jgi:ribosomal subunit interface protein
VDHPLDGRDLSLQVYEMAMEMHVTGRGLHVNDSLGRYVDKRLRRPVDSRASVKATRMEVQLYRTSQREIRFGCHVLVRLSHHRDLNIREEDAGLYEAIDKADERLSRAVTEFRDRRLTENRHPKKYSVDRIQRTLGSSRRVTTSS